MISLQHVSKTYKNDVTALDDVSIEIEKGEFVFLVGPSGSGKSSSLRLLLREEEPTHGEVFVAGKNLAKLSAWSGVPKLRRNLGTVFQDFKLLQDKTVFENVSFALEVIGKPKHVIDQRVPEILEYVGLGEKLNNYPDELSGGEQQRVSIARACVNRPLVLLADEPTGNLDPNTSVDIMRLLDKVNKIGTTVVMATHDQAIVDAMRKRVIELDRRQGRPRPVPRGVLLGVRGRVLLPRDRLRDPAQRHDRVRRGDDRVHRAVPVRTRAADPPRDRLVIESITGNVQVQVYVEENASQETIDQIHTILNAAPRGR